MKTVSHMWLNSLYSIRTGTAPTAWVLVALLAGCANPNLRAPVEERSVGSRPVPVPAPVPPAEPSGATPVPVTTGAIPIPLEPSAPTRVPLGTENAGKPGYYTVKPGETLIRVGLETGQNWKDIAKWNNIDNTNLIEAGQVLRVAPPGPLPKPEQRPLDAKPTTEPAPVATVPSTSPPSSAPAAPKEDENVNWLWPSGGAVVSTFDEGKNKGVTLNGKLGDPVLASADGRVVYAGSGLRGYGNLVILKHNNTYLTAYAHNQTLLVKEDQSVKRGQKIAEMGSSDADRVQLHFEIRKQGKPVDPLKLLPTR